MSSLSLSIGYDYGPNATELDGVDHRRMPFGSILRRHHVSDVDCLFGSITSPAGAPGGGGKGHAARLVKRRRPLWLETSESAS